ncbi:uncharacterized protein LOC128221085 [Mya arenaria]|uniref:uncharacterized protein LOC128221085 n=1 Tax=Mya arenaria TaxID=6604 RepID=UPI0022E650DA|nr:uncharacterized protein LOC128221085 [Mya arenaria]
MVISVILFVVVIAAVTTFGNADITSLEKKVDLISSMQSFVLQDMMLIKGKLANTDVKLEQLFNQIDKLQSSEHERVSTEKGIEQTSAKVVQQVSERIDHQKLGQSDAWVSEESAATLEDLENKVTAMANESSAKQEVLEQKVNEIHNAVKLMGTGMATVANTLNRVKRGFAKEKLSMLNEVVALKEATANVKKAIEDVFVDFNKTMDTIEHRQTEIITKLKTDIETMVTYASDNIAETVENESLKATRLLQDTLNYIGKNVQQLSSEISSAEVNISSKLYDKEREVINKLDNISSECVNLSSNLDFHDKKMMFIQSFDGNGFMDYLQISGSPSVWHFHVPGAMARLVNATRYDTNGVQGRLEVYVNKEWGSVCDRAVHDDDYDGTEQDTVACRTLGASFTKGLALPNTPFGLNTKRIVMSKECDGHEQSLFDCRNYSIVWRRITCRKREVHLRCFA